MRKVEDQSIGILGGGQLALLLSQAAARLGFRPEIFAGASTLPSLRSFLANLKLVIFENEFVDCDLLQQASQGFSVQFLPSLETIRTLQDKLSQKNRLRDLGIPTSPFREIFLGGDLSKELSQIAREFGGNFVLKWAKFGYDGKGVLVLGDLSETSLSYARAFVAKAQAQNSRVYAEKFVPFKRELAMVGSFSVRGEFAFYPLVESEQLKGVCKWVYNFDADSRTTEKVSHWLKSFAQNTKLYGSFAFEFFELTDGELSVNEIAPRVHNTGHYSIEGAQTSQFENHWRAVLGESLGETQVKASFVMMNLLGPEGIDGVLDLALIPHPPEPVQMHLYGKRESRPGRKLGHCTVVSEVAHAQADLKKKLAQFDAKWLNHIQSHLIKGP